MSAEVSRSERRRITAQGSFCLSRHGVSFSVGPHPARSRARSPRTSATGGEEALGDGANLPWRKTHRSAVVNRRRSPAPRWACRVPAATRRRRVFIEQRSCSDASCIVKKRGNPSRSKAADGVEPGTGTWAELGESTMCTLQQRRSGPAARSTEPAKRRCCCRCSSTEKVRRAGAQVGLLLRWVSRRPEITANAR